MAKKKGSGLRTMADVSIGDFTKKGGSFTSKKVVEGEYCGVDRDATVFSSGAAHGTKKMPRKG